MLKVNPEMLTELANTLTTVVEALKARKPDASVDGPVINLAGSDTARACCDIPAEIKVRLDLICSAHQCHGIQRTGRC